MGDVRLKTAQNEVDTYPFSHYTGMGLHYRIPVGHPPSRSDIIARFNILHNPIAFHPPLDGSSPL